LLTRLIAWLTRLEVADTTSLSTLTGVRVIAYGY
jgi:hypothetical protein